MGWRRGANRSIALIGWSMSEFVDRNHTKYALGFDPMYRRSVISTRTKDHKGSLHLHSEKDGLTAVPTSPFGQLHGGVVYVYFVSCRREKLCVFDWCCALVHVLNVDPWGPFAFFFFLFLPGREHGRKVG